MTTIQDHVQPCKRPLTVLILINMTTIQDFKKGYELLPREQEYYLFECCRHRVCTICGKHADIHHVDVLGAGMNRNHVDHTKRHVMALCRIHHSEIEQIGAEEFSSKYHVPVDGIKLDKETLKRIGLRGNYDAN